MYKNFTLALLLSCSTFFCKAQAPAPAQQTEPYGKVSAADLTMTDCEFEKGAGAEILFDKGFMYSDMNFRFALEKHVRIKIFKQSGREEANIKIAFINGVERVSNIQAETINMANGKPEITPLDKKQIITQAINKYRSEVVFSLPAVRDGSVIEYKYTKELYGLPLPAWSFQHIIPTRYSEIKTSLPGFAAFKLQTTNMFMPIGYEHSEENRNGYTALIDKRWLSNVVGLPDEAYMSSRVDNLEAIQWQLVSVNLPNVHDDMLINSWPRLGKALHDDDDFGGQLKRHVTGEDVLIAKAKSIKSTDERIAYLFNEVKNTMKWNDQDEWFTIDGVTRAWTNKAGNATEINLILNHLLQQSGIGSFPMIVSTRDNGKVNPVFPYVSQFNRAVVYIPIDSTKYYLLDASDKYNVYNQVPFNMLNSSGLYITNDVGFTNLIFFENVEPAREQLSIDAEIKADGHVAGSADVESSAYFKQDIARYYKIQGEKKYIDYLRNGDNSLNISAIKMENMDVDTLPLSQKIDFSMDLPGSDGTFIYFNPNILSSLKNNPFLNENRLSSIDFGYNKMYSISEVLKMPAGYKSEVIPKAMSLVMPDQSIIFKRMVMENDGQIIVRYSIVYKKSIFFKEEYPDLHEFYKKMQELLNEQVVLKKA